MTATDTIRELMNKYNEYRVRYIRQYGTSIGFDAWFTTQVIK